MVIDSAEDYLHCGNTRFGGDPDLPISIQWPYSGNPHDQQSRFSNFIAQINFTDLPPKSGILYLFVRYMECAAEPVLLDAIFYEGPKSSLRRTPSPAPERLADEYLVDLQSVKIRGVPAISLASFRKDFRKEFERLEEIGAEDGNLRRINLESDLQRKGQIGQLLGFANAGDERENLYRQLYLARIGKRELTHNDYWDSIAEYEAYMEEWREAGEEWLVKKYQTMRPGVTWLVDNRQMISKGVAEWRLLFRIDSNREMGLNMMDGDPLYVFIRDGDLAKRSFGDLAGEVTQG
jgi:Domain of unknown function (DUF1963)